jgi:hypothetical protein
MKKQNGMNRRKFLHTGAVWAAGSSAVGGTALSYGRIVGANDRISLGHARSDSLATPGSIRNSGSGRVWIVWETA